MITHGVPPYLECSTKGDDRFSPFCAIVNGSSIESQYQAAKILEDGRTGLTWKETKGHIAINQDEINILYSKLWDQYIEEHPNLLDILLKQSGLSDIFGRIGYPCQATELWRIRNAKLNNKHL